MAENQTASEDSGQQQQQQQQPQDQQQNNQQSQQQDSSPDQDSSSDSITPNPRSKTMNMRNSLTSIKVPRAVSSTTNASAEGSHQSHGSGKHHHHNHHHNHLHNNAGHHVIHRTTSESLRLGSDYPGGSSSSMTNSTSNSSSTHGGGGSSSTTPNNSNTTTSNHSHSMSSTSSHSHSHSHPHSHSHSSHHSHSHQHISNSSGGPMQRKQKTSSFQITSVTVGNKLSSDNGDDSADDLDESHTDDNSRITDLENETPSVSEDTFSKEDVFFSNNALSTTAPVIPTSAQYGLVVVDPIGPSVGQTIQNVQVNVADNIINVVSAVGNKKKPEVKETQHRSERFKVVKIESTEPFRRGRWMCMDYLDHSGNQVLNKDITPEKNVPGSSVSVATAGGEDSSRGTTQTGIIVTNDANAAAGTAAGVENHIDAAAKLTADGNLNIYRSESQTSAGTGQTTNQTITHAHTLGGPINMQQQQQQQLQTQLPNQFQGQHFEGGHGQTMPLATDFQQQSAQHQVNGNDSPSVTAGQSQPASFFANQLNAISGGGGGGSSTPASFQQPQQQQQATPVHGVTLPANIQMQNGNGGGGNGNGTNFQPTSYVPPSVASSGADIAGTPATSIQQQTGQQSTLAYTTQPGTSVAPQSYPSGSNLIGSAAYNNAPVTHQLVGETVQPAPQQSDSNAATSPGSGGSIGGQPQQQFQPVHPNPLAGQTMPILNQMTYDIQSQQQPSQSPSNSPATISDPTAIAATIQQQQQIDNNNFTTNNNGNTANNNNNNNNNNNQPASSSSTTAESSTNITTSAGGSGGSGGGTTATSNNISSQQQQPPPPSSSSSLSVAGSIQGSTSGGSAAAPSTTGSSDDHQLHHNPETETESASGTSAVAIDNKIEQAMDLVKSHLMIAVREEVEVLKEKISELMDKINQLEVENTILKSNMSQETLHQLQLQAQVQIAGSGTGNLIAAAPQPQPQPQPQQPTTQASQQPSQNQQQQQATPQANTANTTNGPMS